MLEEDEEKESELVFIVARAASILDDELLKLRLEVWLVLIRVLTVVRAASTLEDELDMELELVLRAVSTASTLEEELLRLRLDV